MAGQDRSERPGGARGDAGTNGLDLRARLLTLRTLLSALLAVVLLVLLFRVLLRVDFGAMLGFVARADPLVLAGAFFAHYVTFPLRAWRWRYLLHHAGIEVRLRDATEIFCLSWFVNLLAPARLGDLYRVYLLRAHNHAPLPQTIGTLLLERVFDILGVFLVAVTAGLLSFRGRVDEEVEWLLFIGIGLAVGIVVLVAVLRAARGWVAQRLPARAESVWQGLQEGADATMTPKRAAVTGGITLVIWMIEGFRLYLVIVALALPEIDIGPSAAIFVSLISALFSILPLTPGGVGLVEGGIVYALGVYGASTDAAAAVALTDRSITLVSVMVLGSILYLASRKARRGVST